MRPILRWKFEGNWALRYMFMLYFYYPVCLCLSVHVHVQHKLIGSLRHKIQTKLIDFIEMP